MNNKKLKMIIPTVLTSILLLTGCTANRTHESTANLQIFDSQYGSNVSQGVIEDSVDEEDKITECTLSEFLNSGTHYFFAVIDNIKKDEQVVCILKTYDDGTCVSYRVWDEPYELGELTRMSDEELDELINTFVDREMGEALEYYQSNWETNYDEALEITRGFYTTPYEYRLVAKTDASGNNVASEHMVIPSLSTYSLIDENDTTLINYYRSGYGQVQFIYHNDCQIYEDNITTFLVGGSHSWGNFLCVKNNEKIKIVNDSLDLDGLIIDPSAEELKDLFPKTQVYSINLFDGKRKDNLRLWSRSIWFGDTW